MSKVRLYIHDTVKLMLSQEPPMSDNYFHELREAYPPSLVNHFQYSSLNRISCISGHDINSRATSSNNAHFIIIETSQTCINQTWIHTTWTITILQGGVQRIWIQSHPHPYPYCILQLYISLQYIYIFIILQHKTSSKAFHINYVK